MDQAVQDFIDKKRIAVVGVSRDDKKFGNAVYKELKERGYQVYAVHAAEKQFQGEPCYPDLASLQGKADAVFVCVRPQKAEEVVRQAAQAGFKNIWLQQGAESPQAIAAGKELGLSLVSGKCVLMYAPPVRSFHSFHRFFVKLFGQL